MTETTIPKVRKKAPEQVQRLLSSSMERLDQERRLLRRVLRVVGEAPRPMAIQCLERAIGDLRMAAFEKQIDDQLAATEAAPPTAL